MNAARTRATLHLARESDAPVAVKRLDGESQWHFDSRCASIRALGVRWVKHPAYRFIPLHSTSPEVWRAAFAEWWKGALELARADRERNPAFKRAQAVRAAVGDA